MGTHFITSKQTMSSHPRISFSNDFVDSHHSHHLNQRPESAPSTDFEFSVSNYSMMSADELFSKGKLLPFQEQTCKKPVTLREELMAGEEEEGGTRRYSARPPKGWREILGLKKGHVGSRKHDKNNGSNGERRMSVGYDPSCSTKASQDRDNEGGSSRIDGDFNFRM